MKLAIIAVTLLTITLVAVLSTKVSATPRGEKYKVSVMEFGTFQEIDVDNLPVEGTEKSLYAMVSDTLVDTGMFSVIDRRYHTDRLTEAGVKTAGKIAPASIKKIGELLNVPYLICGNVISISTEDSEFTVLAGGVKIYSVRAEVSLYLIDAASGKYIRGAKGEGTSSSSKVKAGTDVHTVSLGAQSVATSSVTSALLKASRDAVDKLVLLLNKGGGAYR